MKEKNDLIKITFINGDTDEFWYDWEKMFQRCSGLGMKGFRAHPDVLYTPLSTNWLKLERIDSRVNEEDLFEHEEEVMEQEIPEELPEQNVQEKKESINEKKDRMLKEMMELSECSHEEYDMYFSMMNRTDKRTGKTTSIKRYFPVCANCGVREKFVKSADLPDEVKEAAKLWDK